MSNKNLNDVIPMTKGSEIPIVIVYRIVKDLSNMILGIIII